MNPRKGRGIAPPANRKSSPTLADRAAETARKAAAKPGPRPVIELRVFWEQIPGQLADRFVTECEIDPDAGSLVRSLAVLYAERAMLASLERQNLLGASGESQP